MNAIREKHDEHLAIRIDPDRSARISGVTICAFGEILARAVIAIGGVPSECAMTSGAARK
jgi:hypothetical protein